MKRRGAFGAPAGRSARSGSRWRTRVYCLDASVRTMPPATEARGRAQRSVPDDEEPSSLSSAAASAISVGADRIGANSARRCRPRSVNSVRSARSRVPSPRAPGFGLRSLKKSSRYHASEAQREDRLLPRVADRRFLRGEEAVPTSPAAPSASAAARPRPSAIPPAATTGAGRTASTTWGTTRTWRRARRGRPQPRPVARS